MHEDEEQGGDRERERRCETILLGRLERAEDEHDRTRGQRFERRPDAERGPVGQEPDEPHGHACPEDEAGVGDNRRSDLEEELPCLVEIDACRVAGRVGRQK